MENWIKATLIVIGGLLLIGAAVLFLPAIVAALGIVAGIAAVFLPVIILVIVIAVVKAILDERG